MPRSKSQGDMLPRAAAGVIGAVAGAAAGMFLANASNRKKLMDAFEETKTEGSKRLGKYRATAHDLRTQLQQSSSAKPSSNKGRKSRSSK